MGPPPPSLFAQTVAQLRDDVHALMERQVWEGDTPPAPSVAGPVTTGTASGETGLMPDWLQRMRGSLPGSAGPGMTTDEVMAMTRGED